MKKNIVRSLLITFLGLSALLLTSTRISHAGSDQTASWRVKVAPDLVDQLDAGAPRDSEIDVIIRASGKLRRAHRQMVMELGGKPDRIFRIINGFSARMSLSAIQELSMRDEFAYISPVRPAQSFGHLENTTGAAQIRNMIPGNQGLTGAGVGIALIDSGVNPTHHEIDYDGNNRISMNLDAGGFGTTNDLYGHGTFVASIATGTNHIGPGAYTGIAPGANIINIKALDSSGSGFTTNVIAAVDWCVANRSAYNIKVINMSLGAPAVDSYKNDPLCLAVRAAHDAGIVVVCAAGNDGKDAAGNEIYGAIHCPGDEPSAITVGASNTYGTDARNDDTITTYSSRGPTRGYSTNAAGVKIYDNLVKPDLVAPGNKIISSEALNCNLVVENPQLKANEYETNPYHYVMYLSGTSVSAPVVSGAAALLLQENPSLTPNLIKAILMYTSQPLPGFNMLEQGAGQVNVAGAVQLAHALKTSLAGLSNGQAMMTGLMPQQQTTIAGQTFQWGQGVITNWTFLYGSALMTYWQGMYAEGTVLADGTELTSGQIVKNPVLTTPGVSLAAGIVLAEGSLLADGTMLADATMFANGILMTDGSLLADGMLISDGTLVADGILLADGTTLGFTNLNGDSTPSMQAVHDNTTQ